MIVLVGGGAGGVGEGIVRALIEAGHTAIVPSRNPAKLDLLRARVASDGAAPRLVTWTAQIGHLAGAAEVRDRIVAEFGALDVAIASLGGWWENGRLVEMTHEEWEAVIHEMLGTHFVFARTFVPLLERQGRGRYLALGGSAAYVPLPGAGPVCIAGAGQLMLTRIVRAETDPRVDVLELVVEGPVRTRDSETIAGPDWVSADAIGAIARELAERGATSAPETSTDGPIVTLHSRAIGARHG